MDASSESSEENLGLLFEKEGRHEKVRHRPVRSPGGRAFKVLLGLFSASVLLNFILSIALLLRPRAPAGVNEPPSQYANLQRNREEPYVLVTQYANTENATHQDQLWHDINVDAAVVALSDEWAARHDLRTAQRFPWDPSKGIYILHGFHNLHCLKIVYLSLAEHRRGDPQSRSWHHVSHCLDALRRQILCDADDTPRATERRAEVVSGLWQHRRCRSWDELEAFARRHTACYKRPEKPEEGPHSKLDRFKHCPPDSGYVVTDDYVSTDELLVGLPEESIESA